MSEAVEARRIWDNPAAKLTIVGAVALLLGFGLGFVPAWITAQSRAKELTGTRKELQIRTLQNLLGFAAVHARRGNYEPARQHASEFFTRLRQEVDLGTASALNPTQRDQVAPLFSRRDNLITLLARGDPASADRLSDLYVAYVEAIEGKPPTRQSR